MLGHYLELPRWLRATVAMTLIVVGMALAVTGRAKLKQLAPEAAPQNALAERSATNRLTLGVITTGVGGLLLLTCGRSRSESNGYRF